mgnify:FL=1
MANTKRALLTSALAIVACVAMLIGSTFAWFTDTAGTAVNKIQAGNLKIGLEMLDDNGNWVTAKNKTLQFKVGGKIPAEGNQILWEPGCTYELPKLRLINEGNLALKYTIEISGINGDAKLNEAIDWTIGDIGSADAYTSLAVGEIKEFTIKGHMQETADNEYQGLSINGIAITVFATQDTVESDSYGPDYDKDAGTARYTLAEFNALTAIPEDVRTVYLDIGDVSLADGDVTIGNKDICDMWTWDKDTDHEVGEILKDGRKVYMVRDKDTIYSSNKPGITLYISGSVSGNNEGGLNNKGDDSDPNSISLSIPDASRVVFTKDFTVNGYFRMYTGWSDGRNLGGAFYNRRVKTVLFDHSTFNGIWIQNGGFGADSLTLDGCTFNAYTNKVSANDSNPLWFCGTGSCDITVKNCSFKASRPIKLAEQSTSGTKLTVVDNTFDMGVENSANKEGEPKNDAIMLCQIGNGTLGNVVISGNKVENATALLAFYQPAGFTMAKGATFTVSGNTLGTDVKTGVVWKSATAYMPDFVTVK